MHKECNYWILLFKYFLISLILFPKESKAQWNLVFNDEFNNKTLDANKWEIEDEKNSCHGNYINQLSCNINNSENLRLIGGTLAITAIRQKYLDKEYTSAKIITKQGFTYGKFEIRAALPKGKMLRPTMFMIPVVGSPNWAATGQIDVMTNTQNSELGSGLHYNSPAIYDGYQNGIFSVNTSLNYFNIYRLEWNALEIKWFFNDYNYLTINISKKLGFIYDKNGQPFDKPFRLVINLGVGASQFFPNMFLTLDDVMDWKCSLFILDYVRIYEWVNETKKLNQTFDEISVDHICESVMHLISPKKKIEFAVTTIISVISLILLIVLIIIVLFLLIRQRKLKRNNIEIEVENYDDICEDMCDTDKYDVVDTGNEYADPYMEMNEYSYIENDKCNHFNKEDHRDSDPRYLIVTDAISCEFKKDS